MTVGRLVGFEKRRDGMSKGLRNAIVGSVVLVMVATVGATAQSKTKKTYTIAIDNGSGYGFPFPAAEGKGVAAMAKKLGVKVVANLDGKNDPQKEAANVQDII